MQLLAALWLFVASGQPATSIRIPGSVRDATGLALPGATIDVDGTLVAVSNDEGQFEIALADQARVTVRVFVPGFESRETVVSVGSGTRLDVVLSVGRVEGRVTVVAPPASQRVERPFELDPVQTYRTPGAQADLFRTLQTLPGVATTNEVAGLFVRGGDLSEVLVSLDDGVIAHPYGYETPTGGFRGAVDPLLVRGLTFSTGGFSARYGNALSAIVDLHGLERSTTQQISTTFGLAGASASIGAPVSTRFDVRAATNLTFSRLLFAVNGSPREFDPPPGGWDGSAGFGLSMGRAGRVKGFALVQRDRVGVELEQDAFVGWLRSSARHRFLGLRWDGALGRWLASASLGADAYERGTSAGVLDLTNTDRVESWRVDLDQRNDGAIRWRVGANGSVAGTTMAGSVPQKGGDLGGVSGHAPFDVNVGDWFGGTYLEATTTAGALSITSGARIDRFGQAESTSIDPRLNVRVDLGRARALRFATGIYRQAPGAAYYDRERGASRLPPMEAIHYVAGYEMGHETEGFYLRAEGYLKDYRRLPLEDATIGYSWDGYGSARGLDLFSQWLVSLDRELDTIRDYLEIERIRFGERLDFMIQAEGDALHVSVPPFLLQPLVENAVKHGIEPYSRHGDVRVTARLNGSRLHVTIADTGDGLDAGGPTGTGRGLELTRRRLHAIYGDDAQCLRAERCGDGFAIDLELPVRPDVH